MKNIILVILLFTGLMANDEIKMYTEQYPPYNMQKKGEKLTGLSVEILEAMLKKMGSKQTIDDVVLANWARSYETAKKYKNAMVFSTTRTETREKLFKWVGPVATATVGAIAPKSKKLKIQKFSDLKKYKIGAVLKDIGETILLENGISKDNIDNVAGEKAIDLSFKKMKNNRIDMFVYNTNVALANAKTKGYDVDKYEIVFIMKKGYQYFAFNKDTDEQIIDKWQEALDAIKEDGTYKKIYKRYFK